MKRIFKSNKFSVIYMSFVFILPLVIGFIKSMNLPNIINISSSELLTYYGSAITIIGSVNIVMNKKEKIEKSKYSSLKPKFIIDITKNNDDIFVFEIKNQNQLQYSCLYVYDEHIKNVMNDNEIISLTFNKKTENVLNINNADIIDYDGYPKYFQLCCDDIDGNMWNCVFTKINDAGKVYYYPKSTELV